MKISRRTLLGGLAALPAAAGPGRAFSPSAAPSGVHALTEAHRAARAALTAAGATYEDTLARTDLPEPRFSLTPFATRAVRKSRPRFMRDPMS